MTLSDPELFNPDDPQIEEVNPDVLGNTPTVLGDNDDRLPF